MSEEQLELTKLLAGLRNALQGGVETIHAYFNWLGQQQGFRDSDKKWTWTPSKIKWVQAEGAKGPYERYPAEGQKAEATADYKALLADLKAHDGKLTRDGWFYWLFQDGATVGRKKRGREKKSEAKPEPEAEIPKLFPEHLRSLLSFEQKPDKVVIKPRQYLGSENFARILAIVREAGGEYVSAGKDSHFIMPLKKPSDIHAKMERNLDRAKQAGRKLTKEQG